MSPVQRTVGTAPDLSVSWSDLLWEQEAPGSNPGIPTVQGYGSSVSAPQGWAYEPGLFFTRDGGATWQAARTTFRLTGPFAGEETSTWAVGQSDRRRRRELVPVAFGRTLRA
jgi:hypothetical protein